VKAARSGHRGVFWQPNPGGTQELRRPGAPRERGDWWIRYFCVHRHKHRELVGAKSAAHDMADRRRQQARTEDLCLTDKKRDRPIAFSEIVDDYVKHQETHNRPPHNDCVRIKHWKERWGDRAVTSITRQDVDQGKQALVERRDPQRTPRRHKNKRSYRPATVNRYLAALRDCFNIAIRNGKAVSNPVVGTRFLRENNGRLKYLPSPEAERALLDAVPDARRREMVEIAIHTGLRWSEQRGLR
jgi:hypothetical protein